MSGAGGRWREAPEEGPPGLKARPSVRSGFGPPASSLQPPAFALLLALLPACARVDYDVADLQLDVAGALPDGAETLHICVSNVGELEQGAGNGRAAFTGLRAGEAVDVSLDVWDVDGNVLASAGPATLDGDTPWASTPLLDPAEPCTASGGRAPDDAETWLLAVRFAEEL